MQILDVEGTFKGEFVRNPKEMFLEYGEGWGVLPLMDTRWGHGKRTLVPSAVRPVTVISRVQRSHGQGRVKLETIFRKVLV
jgi:hypothetical protein